MERKNGTDYIGIGRRVRGKRRELALTQEKLAERAGVSSSFIGHIERAEKIPSVETVMKLAYAMKTTTDYLICGVELRCDRKRCPLYGDMIQLMRAYGLDD